MRRIEATAIEKLSAYALSLQVAQIRFFAGVEKAVLRAICDHYPKVWVSVETLADESGWCERAVQAALRNLEAGNWICPVDDRVGGPPRSSGQYIINDRKILNSLVAQHREDAISREPCRCTVNTRECGCSSAPDQTSARDAGIPIGTGAPNAPTGAGDSRLGAQEIPNGCIKFETGAVCAPTAAPDAYEPITNLSGNLTCNQSGEPDRLVTTPVVVAESSGAPLADTGYSPLRAPDWIERDFRTSQGNSPDEYGELPCEARGEENQSQKRPQENYQSSSPLSESAIIREYEDVFNRVAAEASKPRKERQSDRDITLQCDSVFRVTEKHRREAVDMYRALGREETLPKWESFLVNDDHTATEPVWYPSNSDEPDSSEGRWIGDEVQRTWLLHDFVVKYGDKLEANRAA
jgi:hypothetical protein